MDSRLHHSVGRLGRSALAAALHYSGVARLRRHIALRDSGVVLMYHRVLPRAEAEAGGVHPGMYVTPATFARHLRFLSSVFEVTGLDQFREWCEGARSYSRIPCVVTFDDGWEDNYRYAFPLLREHALPATVFLVTGQIDTPGMLSWEQVREMERHGLRFGSHTASHAILTQLPPEQLEIELTASKVRLDQETVHPSSWFCYPKGAFNPAVMAAVRRHYDAALTTRRGAVRPGDDRFQLHRIGVHDDVSFTNAMLACRLGMML